VPRRTQTRPAPRRPAARYRRRRLTAIGALAAVVAALVWLIVSPGRQHGRGTPSTPVATHRTHRATTPAHQTPTAALPLTGIPLGHWTSLPDAPTSRGEVSGTRIGDFAYVVGGFDAAGHTSNQVQRLDLRTDRWSDVTPLPVALNHMSAVGYQGKLYVVGGYSSPGDTSTGAVRGFWRYDPGTRQWQTMPDAPVARAAAGAAILGHRLYVAGGRNDTTAALSSVAIFDFDSGRWVMGPALAHPREHVAAVATDNAVWVLGGRALGLGTFTYVERYVPGSGAWQSLAAMPVARAGFQAVHVGNGIVTVGGEDGSSIVPEVDRLDLGTGRWGRLPDLPAPRHGLGLVADGPLVFAIDGGPQPGLTTSTTVSRLRIG
jgi:hypothetical protein